MKYALIACSKSKHNLKKVNPELLYSKSTLNRLSTDYCKKNNIDYYYISAKFNLLDKKDIIDYYDTTLNNFRKQDIIEWSRKTFKEIINTIPKGSDIYILAGEIYYKYMLDDLNSNYKVTLVFSNLKGIGYIISFLKKSINNLNKEGELF